MGETHQDHLRWHLADQEPPHCAGRMFPVAQMARQGAAVAKAVAPLQKGLQALPKEPVLLLPRRSGLSAPSLSPSLERPRTSGERLPPRV